MTAGIRKASRADVDAVVDMVRSFYMESSYSFEATAAFAAVDELLSHPDKGAVWVVVDDGQAAGYCVLTYGFSIEYGGADAFVDELWISPALRGEGLGTRLLDLMEAECRARNVGALHLEVERANPGVQRMYRARGFADNDRVLITKKLD